MCSLIVGYKIEITYLSGIEGSPQGGDVRISDGTRWQAADLVSVVRVIELQVPTR